MNTINKFKNMDDALTRLLEVMPIKEIQQRNNLVIAISYSGVVFAQKLALVLESPFDLLFTASIPAPLNPDCPIAMVSETNDIITHDALIHSFGISNDYIYGEAKRRYEEEILSTIYKVRKGQVISSLKGEDIIIVDGGIDSGMKVATVIKSCISRQAKSISVAIPVMPLDIGSSLQNIVDNLYAILRPEHFVEVASYYDEYESLPEDKVEDILEQEFLKEQQKQHKKENKESKI